MATTYADTDDYLESLPELTVVVPATPDDIVEYSVSELPPDPTAILLRLGRAARKAYSQIHSIEDVLTVDLDDFVDALTELHEIDPKPVPVVSEIAHKYCNRAVSQRFVSAALYHRPGKTMDVLFVDAGNSIVGQFRNACERRDIVARACYLGPITIANLPRVDISWLKARRAKFDMIVMCHASASLADGSFVDYRRYLKPEGVISVLATEIAPLRLCADAQILSDNGKRYKFMSYGKMYEESYIIDDDVRRIASTYKLRMSKYDANGQTLIANKSPFGGEFGTAVDVWKAYSVYFFSGPPLSTPFFAATEACNPDNLVLSRPKPMQDTDLVSVMKARVLVKEKTDGFPVVIRKVNKKFAGFKYVGGGWQPFDVNVPESGLEFDLQIEVTLEDDAVQLMHYIDYQAPGDFEERRRAFVEGCSATFVNHFNYTYRPPDLASLKIFLNPETFEGIVVQQVNSPHFSQSNSSTCFYVKHRPTVDLLHADIPRLVKSKVLTDAFLGVSPYDGVREFFLDGLFHRVRPDKMRSNSSQEIQRVVKQVPYLQTLFSISDVDGDDPEELTDVKVNWRAYREPKSEGLRSAGK